MKSQTKRSGFFKCICIFSSAMTQFSKRLLFLLIIFLFGSFGSLFAISFNSGVTSDSVFQVVDKPPIFKGKPSDIQKFIKKHLIYPEDAWLKGIEGVVQVSFVITRDGKVLNSKVEKSVSAELDMEALRLVDLLDSWKPGLKSGEAVHACVSVFVEFKLSTQEREFINTLEKFGLNENPPLYVIDDKIVNARIDLPSYNLKSVRVLKGDKAVERYGERAKNGVVIITTKRGTPPIR